MRRALDPLPTTPFTTEGYYCPVIERDAGSVKDRNGKLLSMVLKVRPRIWASLAISWLSVASLNEPKVVSGREKLYIL